MGDSVSSAFGAAGNSTGTAAADIFGPGTPGAPNIQVFQPQYAGQADTAAYNGTNTILNNNPFQQYQPAYQQLLAAQQNNPYAAGAQTAANNAGAQYAQVGQQAGSSASAVQNGVQTLLPYVAQVTNTATDPQNALYTRTLQQVRDQANVTNAQNGLTGSPFGVGATNSATNNFNIDWQNSQLARQTQGLSAAGTAIAQAAGASNSAATTGAAAAADTGQAGQVPYANYNENLANQNAALNTYGNSQVAANNNTNTAVQNFLSYLGIASGQSNAQAGIDNINYQNKLAETNAENQGIAGLAPGYGQGGVGGASLPSFSGSSAGGGYQTGTIDSPNNNPGAYDSQGYATNGSGEAANNASFLGDTNASSNYGLYNLLY